MLEQIRIVLVGTTHPGNIGAVARAMKTMGLSNLWLVAPKQFPSAEATARASGADDLLARARVCVDLGQAIDGCRLVVGASARLRTVHWPQLDPGECARSLLAQAAAGPVAILFGRESSGLSNQELDRCSHLVHIPSNPEFSSLNLAAAVQILAYEIRVASLCRAAAGEAPRPVASADAMEGFFAHMEQTLLELRYANPNQSRKLQRRLRRLFFRAAPDTEELNILRGILSAAQGRKLPRGS